MVCPDHAAWRPVGCNWLTFARWAMLWRKNTTALPLWNSISVANWFRWTAASMHRLFMTWCTLTLVLITACATRALGLWAPRADSAIRLQKAWMAVNLCAVAGAMTSSRPCRQNAAIASSIGAATWNARNAQRLWTNLSANKWVGWENLFQSTSRGIALNDLSSYL